MGNFSIANCRRCNKVYKRFSKDVCPECSEIEEAQLRQLYKILQESEKTGGIALEELAKQVNMEPDEIETILNKEGGLGTAAAFVKVPCPMCGEYVARGHLKGKFCRTCGDEIAKEITISQKTLHPPEERKVFHSRRNR